MTADQAGLTDGDYRVEYVNNKSKGTAKIVVTAFTDSTKAVNGKSAKFKIGSRNLTAIMWYKWLKNLTD